MPPLAHPEPLIPEHQQLRADPVDSACSSASASSFFGRLWTNRRRFAPLSKSVSVVSTQEICESSYKQSSHSVRLCKGDNDAHAWSMRLPKWILSAHAQSNPTSVCVEQRQARIESQELHSDLGTQEQGMRHKGVDADFFPDWVSSVGGSKEDQKRDSLHGKMYCPMEDFAHESDAKPVMESLQGVVINQQRAENAETNPRCGYAQDCELTDTCDENANVVVDEGDRRERAEQTLIKRAASFKAGESMSVCGLKKLRLSTLCELQRVVSILQCGDLEERWLAAEEVLHHCRDDPIARVTLGVQLHAIPPLISVLHSALPKHQCTALLALLNLAVGNDVNKAAIVKAKALQRMVALLQSMHAEVQTAVVTLFLSLSALDANKADIGTSGSIPLLVTLTHKEHTKKDALRALYNLSIHAGNVKSMVQAGCVPLLLHLVSDTNIAEKALATLSNLAGEDAGRRAFEEHKELAYAVLVDAMRWMEMPKCQERAVYVLMMIAHYSPAQREAMSAAGVIAALVELSLLGSELAKKRATRTLDSFRRAKACSGPQQRQCKGEILPANGPQIMKRAFSEKKVVGGLVKQSLNRTMQKIARRANLSMVAGDSIPPTSRSFRQPLDQRSSSRSLPF